MKNAAGILLVIYLFFLVPWLAGALIDAAAGVKKRNISSTYANGFVIMLGIFWGVAVYLDVSNIKENREVGIKL